jgi:Fe-S-cluster-containing hydrogenase component 2
MANIGEIRIMRERCVHCGDCLELCPQSGPDDTQSIFSISGEGADVRVPHVENCISCYTCVEYCRAAAITIAGDSKPPDADIELRHSRPANKII